MLSGNQSIATNGRQYYCTTSSPVYVTKKMDPDISDDNQSIPYIFIIHLPALLYIDTGELETSKLDNVMLAVKRSPSISLLHPMPKNQSQFSRFPPLDDSRRCIIAVSKRDQTSISIYIPRKFYRGVWRPWRSQCMWGLLSSLSLTALWQWAHKCHWIITAWNKT